MTEATRRRLALAFVAMLALVLVDGVVRAVHLQRTMPCDQRLCRSPRDLEQWARRFRHPDISARVANFYLLRRHLAHTTVMVGPAMHTFMSFFEDIARMDVVALPADLMVDEAAIPGLIDRATIRRKWLRRGGSEKRWLFQTLYIEVDPAAEAYVWAETVARYKGPIFVIPLDEYVRVMRSEAAR
jgi:hypothetical protein